ncbi:hypothetical protein RCL1_008086 [Eukaryota sp. TZLM3-RCL]
MNHKPQSNVPITPPLDVQISGEAYPSMLRKRTSLCDRSSRPCKSKRVGLTGDIRGIQNQAVDRNIRAVIDWSVGLKANAMTKNSLESRSNNEPNDCGVSVTNPLNGEERWGNKTCLDAESSQRVPEVYVVKPDL